MSVNFYRTTWHNNPEDSQLHTRRRENLKSHIINFDLKKLLPCDSCRRIPKNYFISNVFFFVGVGRQLQGNFCIIPYSFICLVTAEAYKYYDSVPRNCCFTPTTLTYLVITQICKNLDLLPFAVSRVTNQMKHEYSETIECNCSQ
jgi:hypothetical protein